MTRKTIEEYNGHKYADIEELTEMICRLIEEVSTFSENKVLFKSFIRAISKEVLFYRNNFNKLGDIKNE